MGNFTKPRRFVDKVFIHCSAANTNRLGRDFYKWVRRIHVEGQPHRWADVGYHFLIDKEGTLIPARPLSMAPAANPNRKRKPGFAGNRGTIAICLDGLTPDYFNEKQFKTLRELCKEIDDAYRGSITFHGHREVAWKECPVFDYKSVLKLDKDGYLGI